MFELTAQQKERKLAVHLREEQRKNAVALWQEMRARESAFNQMMSYLRENPEAVEALRKILAEPSTAPVVE